MRFFHLISFVEFKSVVKDSKLKALVSVETLISIDLVDVFGFA